jgi:hypothetical protein
MADANRHPADQLADIRSEIRRLQSREELRAWLLEHPADRRGMDYESFDRDAAAQERRPMRPGRRDRAVDPGPVHALRHHHPGQNCGNGNVPSNEVRGHAVTSETHRPGEMGHATDDAPAERRPT